MAVLFIAGTPFVTSRTVAADEVRCGALAQGIECTVFRTDDGTVYLLNTFGGFSVGDRVCVTGSLRPDCGSVCQEGSGCIAVTRIEAPVVASPTVTPTVMPTPVRCVGDCSGDGRVTVDEVLSCVNVRLALVDEPCSACDGNGDGHVTVDEVLTAVNYVFTGCPPR